jgi:hypothetical protein
MVRAPWKTGKDKDMGMVVIVRRTPSGLLVVRKVGETSRGEYRFKWSRYNFQYYQEEKGSSFGDLRKLVDVPSAYMPEIMAETK